MPKLGLTMTEGIVSEWLVQPGATFDAGDVLYVVENDKVANEIEAEAKGTLLEAVVAAGDTVPVGDVIGYWDDGEAEGMAPAQENKAHAEASSKPNPDQIVAAAAPVQQAADDRKLGGTAQAHADGQRIVATPYARKLAGEQGVSLDGLAGTGPNGRIVASDVEVASAARPAAIPHKLKAEAIAAAPVKLQAGQSLIAPTGMQATIARRLKASKQEIPHFYLALDIDVTRLVTLRKEVNRAQETHRLTLNHFIVMAVAQALRQMPEANRVWTDEGILSFSQIDVGVAVGTEDGLLAPAVCDVGSVSMGVLTERLNAVIERARVGRMNQADLGSPAITVSNAGMHHVHFMGSIINPGQAMILGVGSVKAVFRPDNDGQPELRQEMGVVLSADHRIIDGVRGLKFLNIVRELLEQPVRLLVH
nr:dihydrolipoamide acetyltransferase family protein [Pollutimonas harenae]